MFVSVILPTFNEKESILPLIHEVHARLAGHPHEIVVVDDDSPDGTFLAVSQAGLDFVRIFKRTNERSLGASVRHGLERAAGDAVVVMDSDFNHQPAYLPFMVQALSWNDCVSGSRFVYGGRMDTPLRHWLSWMFNGAVRVLAGSRLTDNLYGYFAVRKGTIKSEWYMKIFYGHGDYGLRLFTYLQKHGVGVLEIPMVNGKRRHGAGNTRLLSTFLRYSAALLRLAVAIRTRRL